MKTAELHVRHTVYRIESKKDAMIYNLIEGLPRAGGYEVVLMVVLLVLGQIGPSSGGKDNSSAIEEPLNDQ